MTAPGIRPAETSFSARSEIDANTAARVDAEIWHWGADRAIEEIATSAPTSVQRATV